ncbi:hypothetical protein A6R68_05942, partial [Neotoma lepida]
LKAYKDLGCHEEAKDVLPELTLSSQHGLSDDSCSHYVVAEITTTAASVAVGSALGHIMGLIVSGGFSGGNKAEITKPGITSQEPLGAQ